MDKFSLDNVTYSNIGQGYQPGLSLEGMKEAISKLEKIDLNKLKQEQNALLWYTRMKRALEKDGINDIPDEKLSDLARYMAWKDEHKWDFLMSEPIVLKKYDTPNSSKERV